MLLEKSIDGFVIHLESKERSKETIRGYRMLLYDFRKHIEHELNGSVYVDEITVDYLESYLIYRKRCGDQPRSRNRALYIFRSFYEFLVRRDYVERNIAKKLEPVNEHRKERVYLTLEEVEQILAVIKHPLVHVATTTLAFTGLRVSELCNLTLNDVDLENSMINVIAGKGNKDRIVPINTRIQDMLVDYVNNIRPDVSSDRFFATKKTGKLSPYYINRHLKEAVDEIGFDKHVTAHILRHSFASALVRNNAPLPAIQSLLGHSDLRITSVYIHQDVGQLKDAVNLL